jgi:hypothetical protein
MMPPSPDTTRAVVQPRATILGAFVEGWRRTLRAPALAIGLLVVIALAAPPLADRLDVRMPANAGMDLRADTAANGWGARWAAEFHATGEDVRHTFARALLGFGGTLPIVSRAIDGRPLDRPMAAAVVVYLGLWTLLSGGVLDRLARGRREGPAAFVSACRACVFRFLRLAPLVAAAYWALFRWLHPLLLTTIYGRVAGDFTGEPQALVVRGILWGLFLACLAVVGLTVDFIAVRLVVEDRRSVIGATAAALRFMRRRAWRIAGLAILNAVAALIVARLWLQVAPGPSAANWLVLGLGLLYLLARLWARLAFMASEVVFFQGELAHAQYTARSRPAWPDSPAAEAVRPRTDSGRSDRETSSDKVRHA